ncbi:MAG: zinc-binding alcohol dehydrogenase [Candidatus Latescibacterota bacterium]|nr:zinc-binding alcohol dehydrogenase [Candidatus Latescibacterota bacterium]
MKVRRLHCTDKAQIEVAEVELADPADGQILVENACTAVSVGTELYVWLHGAEPGRISDYPHPTGYCSAGTVIAKGPDVEGVEVGDRVAAQGCHASHQILDKNYHRIPVGVDWEDAVYLVMAAIAIRSVRKGRLTLGESLVVLGAGIVGQLALTLARLSGAMPVIAVDLDEGRLAHALRRGADLAIDPTTTDDIVQAVRDHCVDDGARVVIEATGKPAVYPLAVQLASTGGRVVALGSPRGTVEMDFMRDVHLREVDLIGAFQPLTPERDHVYYPWTKARDRRLLLELMAQGKLAVRDLITHRFAPEQCQVAYETLAGRPEEALGVIFEW